MKIFTKQNIRIIQINKANGELYNRITQIKDTIEEYKADIIVINEANLHRDDKISQYRFDGFIMEKDYLGETSGKHHTITLIKNHINYKRVNKWETKIIQ